MAQQNASSPAPGSTSDHLDRFQPVALVAAILLPGLGQFFLGFRARAACIAAGVLGLFFSGIFIGGLDSVDRREDGVWFIGQALVGPVVFATDYLHQTQFKGYIATGNPRMPEVLRSADPGESLVRGLDGRLHLAKGGVPPLVKSVGRANEIGTLFSAIAGMLNLIVIIDAAFCCTRREHDDAVREAKEHAETKARLAAQAGGGSPPAGASS